jgi:hypothetical protein
MAVILASLAECCYYLPHSPMNEKAQFKATLRRHINTHSFFCVDKLLVMKNGS